MDSSSALVVGGRATYNKNMRLSNTMILRQDLMTNTQMILLLMTIALLGGTKVCDSFLIAPSHQQYHPSLLLQRRLSLPSGGGHRHQQHQVMSDEYLEDDTPPGDNDDGYLSDDELRDQMGDWDESVPQFNIVHLTGRVGNVPEAKYFDDGSVVVNLSLACKQRYHPMERQLLSPEQSQEPPPTDWFSLSIWGQKAEFVAKFVDKGTRLGVVGTLEIDEWNDRETGILRNKAKILVRDFEVLESRAEAELRRNGQPPAASSSSNNNNDRRGPSFYTSTTTGNDDEYDDGRSAAGSGGFF